MVKRPTDEEGCSDPDPWDVLPSVGLLVLRFGKDSETVRGQGEAVDFGGAQFLFPRLGNIEWNIMFLIVDENEERVFSG